MNRRTFVKVISAVPLVLAFGCTPSAPTENNGKNKTESQGKEKGYWTCSMHPQVHQDGPGKCPICGMPLIHVDHQIPQANTPATSQESEGVTATKDQIKNANISKYTVAKKDFVVAIAFSGRLTSSRDLSFQVYESDRSLIKNNLAISGYASTNPNVIKNGHIVQIDNSVEPSSRTIRVTAVLDSSISDFVSDSSFYGQIQSVIKNQIVIPDEAVLHAGKRDLVYFFNPAGKIEPREVVLGQKNKTEYQVISGLKEGDVISAGANFLIDSEAKIRGQ